MLPKQSVDISENDLRSYDEELLKILLQDHTTGGNIIWATESYGKDIKGYRFGDEITIECITGEKGRVIIPRSQKDRVEQKNRSKGNAEVFTPSWICNSQNNLIDEAWFGYKNVFNTEKKEGWTRRRENPVFPDEEGKTWQDYVRENRMEITCGEAPYLASRYDATTGEYIKTQDRIGLLDRKLMVIKQHVKNAAEFHQWAVEAYKSIYGFEFQGDNLLLARENLLLTYMDYHTAIKGDQPGKEKMREIAQIISWNLWQMDGLTYGIPGTTPNENISSVKTLFEDEHPDCTVKFCRIKDWSIDPRNDESVIPFASLITKNKQ